MAAPLCPKCKVNERHVPKSGRRTETYCRPCKRKKFAQWVADNPSEYEASRKSHYERNKARYIANTKAWRATKTKEELADMARRSMANKKLDPVKYARHVQLHRLSRYKMSIGQFSEMLARQGGACAACNDSVGLGKRGICVDHDHKTGRVRGLLCGHCNRAIGHMRDDASIAASIVRYLLSHKADAGSDYAVAVGGNW